MRLTLRFQYAVKNCGDDRFGAELVAAFRGEDFALY
jgi:hypothetical protein